MKKQMVKGDVLTLAVTLAVCSMAVTPVWAANSGGQADRPAAGDYSGDNASSSTVVIDTGVTNNVYGGYDSAALVGYNTVTVGNDAVIEGKVCGGYGIDNKVVENIVTVNSGTVENDFVYGGFSENNAPNHNKAVIQGGKLLGVYGGFSVQSDVYSNEVTVCGNGTVIETDVVGGRAMGEACYNKVNISAGSVGDSLYSGYSFSGRANSNQVTVSGTAAINNDAFGGLVVNYGDVSLNKVSISGGTLRNVYGGEFWDDTGSGNGRVTDNSVEITGGEITGNNASSGNVYGGHSKKGEVSSNKVSISGTNTKIKKDVYGGYTKDGAAKENSLKITGGVIGGYVYGGRSDAGRAAANTVSIEGGDIDGYVYGGFSSSTATKNTVSVSDGDLTCVYGGYSTKADAAENSVDFSGGDVYFDVIGGESAAGSALNNEVTFKGDGSSAVKIYGGKSKYSALENTVTVAGGTVNSSIYGGFSTDGAATGNTVNISGAPVFNETNTVIYGGFSSAAGQDMWTGNTLNVYTKGLTAANVKNFENYNFYLPDDIAQGEAVLTLTGGSGTDISSSKVNVGIQGTAAVLQPGEEVTLLKNDNGITADNVTYGKLTQGVSLEYDFETALSGDGKAITTKIKASGVSDQSKSPVETQAAAVAFINSGADLLAGQGLNSAVNAAAANSMDIFGAMSGGSMRYKTGSHADVHGYNLALGLGKAVKNNTGTLTFGPFAEYGWGNYTSHLDSGIRGDGNTKYYGIGVLARQDNTDGLYYEGSLRYGRMDADYASGDMEGAGGKVYSSYDSSSYYYGVHLGIGKINRLNDTTKSDIYAKLMYTHQGSDSVTLQGEGNGEVYDFDAVDSTRARIGARLSKDCGERGTGYAGLAYEYEFDGEARATVKGFSTPSPSIKGSSGMLELGYVLKAQGANDPSVDIGLQGWTGKKQGVTANVNFVWTF